MNIKNYFLSIGSSMPNVMAPFSDGSATTIADFWDSFVEPRLPNPQIVIELYNLLCQYVDDADAVFAIRCYGNWESDKAKDDYTLRRGFYNLTDKGYSFFYTDNFYAAYFAKMAVDSYVPVYQEFKKHMISREFPARFGRSTQAERDRMAYSIDGKKGKDPGFARNGYKIAHVIDSGKGIYDLAGNHLLTIGDICGAYCARGNYNAWTVHKDVFGDFFARDLAIDSSAKAFLIAHFLRFVCPMNYIFTPGKNNHILGVKVRMNDIAESEELQQYAMLKFHERFGTVYEDYLSRLLLPPAFELSNLPSINHLANKVINIQYGKNMKKTTPKNSTHVPSKGSTPKVNSSSSSTKTNTTTNTLKNKKKIMLIEQSTNKNDLRDRLMAYVTKSKAFVTPLKKISRRAHKLLLDNNCPPSSARQYYNWLDPTIHPELNNLLKKHGIIGSIYTCTNLKKIANMFDELVNNTTDEADKANKHQNMVSAVRHFIEHLLSVNIITI